MDTSTTAARPRVEIVIPVYNEERVLAHSVEKLSAHLDTLPGFEFRITIANNGSIDRTSAVAGEIARSNGRVRLLEIGQKGRGRALKKAWLASDADYLVYMDVDLSTNLEAFPVLLAALQAAYDIVIGSRLFKASRTVRSRRREVISRVYNFLLKLVFLNGFRDAQCGFKGLRSDVARRLLPLVENDNWFFDTELLLLAEASGHRIMEVPVGWIEDLDTRVVLIRTILEDLKGIARLRLNLRRTARRVPGRSAGEPSGDLAGGQ